MSTNITAQANGERFDKSNNVVVLNVLSSWQYSPSSGVFQKQDNWRARANAKPTKILRRNIDSTNHVVCV